MMVRLVIAQNWIEAERGWGMKHYGTSYHKSMADRDTYVREWESKNPSDHVPDYYVQSAGEPKMVEVSREMYNKVLEKGTVFV